MPELTPPTVHVQTSFLAAVAEFRAEGRGGGADTSMIGHEMQDYGGRWADPAVFEEYVRWLREQALEDSPRAAGWASSTTLWWVSGEHYLGRLAIRHRLTPRLLDVGGQYDVRPSARRHGYATAMLASALPWRRSSASAGCWSPATRTTRVRARLSRPMAASSRISAGSSCATGYRRPERILTSGIARTVLGYAAVRAAFFVL